MQFNNGIFQSFYLGILELIADGPGIKSVIYKLTDPEMDSPIPDYDLIENLLHSTNNLTQVLNLESNSQLNYKIYFNFRWDKEPLAKKYKKTTPEEEHVFQFLSKIAVILFDENEEEIFKIDSSPDHPEIKDTFPFHCHLASKKYLASIQQKKILLHGY